MLDLKPEDAWNSFQTAAEIPPQDPSITQQTKAAEQLGDAIKAFAKLTETATTSPENLQTWQEMLTQLSLIGKLSGNPNHSLMQWSDLAKEHITNLQRPAPMVDAKQLRQWHDNLKSDLDSQRYQNIQLPLRALRTAAEAEGYKTVSSAEIALLEGQWSAAQKSMTAQSDGVKAAIADGIRKVNDLLQQIAARPEGLVELQASQTELESQVRLLRERNPTVEELRRKVDATAQRIAATGQTSKDMQQLALCRELTGKLRLGQPTLLTLLEMQKHLQVWTNMFTAANPDVMAFRTALEAAAKSQPPPTTAARPDLTDLARRLVEKGSDEVKDAVNHLDGEAKEHFKVAMDINNLINKTNYFPALQRRWRDLKGEPPPYLQPIIDKIILHTGRDLYDQKGKCFTNATVGPKDTPVHLSVINAVATELRRRGCPCSRTVEKMNDDLQEAILSGQELLNMQPDGRISLDLLIRLGIHINSLTDDISKPK